MHFVGNYLLAGEIILGCMQGCRVANKADFAVNHLVYVVLLCSVLFCPATCLRDQLRMRFIQNNPYPSPPSHAHDCACACVVAACVSCMLCVCLCRHRCLFGFCYRVPVYSCAHRFFFLLLMTENDLKKRCRVRRTRSSRTKEKAVQH